MNFTAFLFPFRLWDGVFFLSREKQNKSRFMIEVIAWRGWIGNSKS